ncbi:MAG: prolyl oligopeptidase family serine peptidase [Verrucomicrobia bacterium]|nr:prolyl oligopeptidase family serine peptidase [Verrucomicrobiota bacterium]
MASGNERPQTFNGRISRQKVGVRYLLFLPRDYRARGPRRWPLIFFLHGAGERGTNVWWVAKHGPPKIVKDKPDFPFIVVSPQCPEGQTWSNDTLWTLLDDVVSRYRVDVSRIYLTGLSMGGYATWSLGLEHPERFAAIAPICGGGDTLKVLLPDADKVRALKTLPVWAFHGGKDPVVNPAESKRMVEALHQIGNEAKLTVYPEAQHDSWTETYNHPALYDWFLEHQRQSAHAK